MSPDRNSHTNPRNRLHLLVAEDNPTSQIVVRRILEGAGFTVSIASNGFEVLSALNAAQFDLILMDIEMKEMDGLEAARQVRKREESRGGYIPIIATTGHDASEFLEKCLEAGMDGFVSKPIDLDELLRTMDRIREKISPSPLKSREDSVPALDRKALLNRLSGDEELARKVFNVFIEDSKSHIQEMEKAMEISDFPALELHSHNLKGAAANVCAISLKEVAGEINRLARSKELERARLLVDRLHEAFERTRSSWS